MIAGGGFGGFYAARTLERVLPPHSARVTLVSDVNFLLFTPLLPGAAAGTLEPRHVVVPLREQLPRTDLWLGRVAGAEPQRRRADRRLAAHDGRRHELRYDQLIVALGSISRTQPIPGLVEHAIGFKTLAEAIALRNRVISMLEIAETIHDAETRAEYLTFVFVGAGYAGLEGVAELQDFMGDVLDMYPRCKVQGMRWVLLEARERVMPEVAPSLAAFAARELRGRGIEIHTGVTIERVEDRSLSLERRPLDPDAHSRVDRRRARASGARADWACRSTRAGASRSTVRCASTATPTSGRSETPPPCRTPHARAPLAADRAARDTPGPARRAQRRRRARCRRARAPFKYRTLGVFVDLGRHQAVASTARDPLARLPRVVPGAHLPHGEHARHQAQAAPARRLDRRAALQPRHRRARPARAPAGAGGHRRACPRSALRRRRGHHLQYRRRPGRPRSSRTPIPHGATLRGPMRFAVKFLGCKVSHADAMLARSRLLAAGHEEVPEDDAELHVINTCCITGEAEAKSRQSVRRSLKTAREVYVGGCAVNLHARQFAEIDPGVRPFTGTADDVAEAMAGALGACADLAHEPLVGRGRRAAGAELRARECDGGALRRGAHARLRQGPGRLRLPLRLLHHPDGSRRRTLAPGGGGARGGASAVWRRASRRW